MVDRRMSREHIPGAALHDPADLRERKSPLERNGRRHAGEHIADRGKLDYYNRTGCCHGKPCGGCGKTLSPKINQRPWAWQEQFRPTLPRLSPDTSPILPQRSHLIARGCTNGRWRLEAGQPMAAAADRPVVRRAFSAVDRVAAAVLAGGLRSLLPVVGSVFLPDV